MWTQVLIQVGVTEKSLQKKKRQRRTHTHTQTILKKKRKKETEDSEFCIKVMICSVAVQFHFYSRSLDLLSSLCSYVQILALSPGILQVPRTIACWRCQGDNKSKSSPCPSCPSFLFFEHRQSSPSTSPVSIYQVSKRRKTGSSSLHTSNFYLLKFILSLEQEERCRGRRNRAQCTNEGENEAGILIILSYYTHSLLCYAWCRTTHTLKRSLKVRIMFYPSAPVCSE